MKLKLVLGAVMAGALCAPCPLMAQTVAGTDHDAVVKHDIQCMMVSLTAMHLSDPKIKYLSDITLSYYLGKLLGEEPNIYEQTAFSHYTREVKPSDNIRPIFTECTKGFMERQRQLQDAFTSSPPNSTNQK